ncbi:MAG: response regulator transcription factor [Ktedonobacterales bacterium]
MRIYVLSPYPAVRAGLAALAREQAGWQVVGESAPDILLSSTASSVLTPDAAPDVVLADLDGLGGRPDRATDVETVDSWLAALHPRAGVVALGGAGSLARGAPTATDTLAARQFGEVARAVEASGLAFGALLRDAEADEIVAAITAVASGLITLDRRLSHSVFAAQGRATAQLPTPAAAADDEPLTAREREVLQLLAQGFPNKIIALRLHISEHTAKFHVSAIMTKLGAASRTEAVTTAARRGLLIL